MVTIVDADAGRWDALADLMGQRGDPSRCWCQFFRSPGPYDHSAPESNREAMRSQLATATVPHGVLALDGQRAVGWCAVAPRGDYPRLARSRVVARATVADAGLWAVTCFVVRIGQRRQGVAERLLAGAVDLARRHGARTVEGYPVDTAASGAGSSGLYPGTLSMFLRAGFAEVARPSASRAVVRLSLTG